ncbi:MAG: DUF3576 domain-containing protein [Robiginitomaculum sp.]|nr:DUF3576 domain-containing protein [Robiginitomaculum sp.]
MSSILTKIVLGATLVVSLTGCQTMTRVTNMLPGADPVPVGKDASYTSRAKTSRAAPRMGVNEFLWRASLETLNFMPLSEIDPFGGVIITDWYASPQAPNERFKANVYILDTNLRADALKVSIFKQVRSANGWNDASVDADTARSIENSILTRARQLYIATVDE